MIYGYPFTQREFEAASREWGCNCGPGALAFGLGVKLDTVRPAIPEFERKRYTSPQMMRAALGSLRATWHPVPCTDSRPSFGPSIALVRIQWTGPWTAPGANPRWAYGQTHWICTWRGLDLDLVFDINGGIMTFEQWRAEIVPLLTALYPRADGGWYPTDCWQLGSRVTHRPEACATGGGGA